ncbi:MAG: hypothetical protein KC502_19450 [Myxococcales bacterium]|nr:hypothetical protein [Myxococcales bacterium]
MSVGTHSVCAIRTDGTLWCWGYNAHAQLGDGSKSHKYEPFQIKAIGKVSAVSVGYYHTCVIKNGAVYCVGYNAYGALGHDSAATEATTWQKAKGISGARSISVSDTHSCAATKTGKVYCWGWDQYGRVGPKAKSSGNYKSGRNPAPLEVTGVSGAIQVEVGYYGSCAVTNKGAVWCWGYGAYYENGNGTKNHTTVPVQVKGITTAVSVSRSSHHVFAGLSDGSVVGWGYNTSGQLGRGTTSVGTGPAPPGALDHIVSYAVIEKATYFVRADGVLWGTGSGFGSVPKALYGQEVTPGGASTGCKSDVDCSDDGNPCTVAKCDKTKGSCSHSAAANGVGCEDGKLCTTGDACSSGKCVGKTKCATCDSASGKCM